MIFLGWNMVQSWSEHIRMISINKLLNRARWQGTFCNSCSWGRWRCCCSQGWCGLKEFYSSEWLRITRSHEIVRKFCGSCAQHKSHHFAIVREFRKTTIYLSVIDRFIQIDFYWFYVLQSFSFYHATVPLFCAQCACWPWSKCMIQPMNKHLFFAQFPWSLKMIFFVIAYDMITEIKPFKDWNKIKDEENL